MINRKLELTRKMGNYDVLQRTSDGFFDANALLRQWNANPENKIKKMSKFLELQSTKEFIQQLEEDLQSTDNEVGTKKHYVDNQVVINR